MPLFGLDVRGVAAVGSVPAGLPGSRLPHVPFGDATSAAAGVALLGFSITRLMARSFAALRGVRPAK